MGTLDSSRRRTVSALILIDGSGPEGLSSAGETLAGIPWLTRFILTGKRSGVREFVVLGGNNLEALKERVEPRTSTSGAPVSWIHVSQVSTLFASLKSRREDTEDLWLVCPWNVFIPKNSWETFGKGTRFPGFSLSDDEGLLLCSAPTARLLEAWAEVKDAGRFLERLGRGLPASSNGHSGIRRLLTRKDVNEAEQELYRDLMKDTEGFMSKHLERKISFAMTRLLVKTPVSPNAITVFNIGLGIFSGYLLSKPLYGAQVAGALLFLFTSIADGCDGEIARLTFQESRWGGTLDFLGDNIVHAAVFWGIALGLDAQGHMRARALGKAAVLGACASALLVFLTTLSAKGRSSKEGGPFFKSVSAAEAPGRPLVAKIDDFLSRRDFIYLVLAAACFGKLLWFLWMAAIGSVLFFASLVFLHLGERFKREVKLI